MSHHLPSQQPPSGLSNRNYNALKLAATLLLPAVQAFYLSLATVWDWENQVAISGTIAAVNVFAGVGVKMSQMLFEASGAGYSGTIALVDTDEGTSMKLLSMDPEAVLTQDSVTFRIAKAPPA